mmetsp:Transcript_1214/g.1724  ORF Transcript_1214/g.1724 Transcript_1214/m.1724 type:complete len:230 (-) Transcript_1214:483-1172(-)
MQAWRPCLVAVSKKVEKRSWSLMGRYITARPPLANRRRTQFANWTPCWGSYKISLAKITWKVSLSFNLGGMLGTSNPDTSTVGTSPPPSCHVGVSTPTGIVSATTSPSSPQSKYLTSITPCLYVGGVVSFAGSQTQSPFCAWLMAAHESKFIRTPPKQSLRTTLDAPNFAARIPHNPVPLPSSNTCAPATRALCRSSTAQQSTAPPHTRPPTPHPSDASICLTSTEPNW